jgi:hypothetical protein
MTIEAAEKILAQLSDQKDRATARVKELAAAREVLAYAALTANDAKARDELATLNQQAAELAVVIANIDSADAEARRRLDAAHATRASAAALVHINHVNKSLAALIECAPRLDVCWGTITTGQAGGFIHNVGPKDPQLFAKAGALIREIVSELKALELDRGVVWPPRRFELMHIDDFRIELEKLVQAFQSGRLVRTRSFVHLIGDWSASVRATLAQHGEQPISEEQAP